MNEAKVLELIGVQAKVLVEALYGDIIQAANRFLFNAKNFHISVLKLENPTYAEAAADIRKVASIVSILSDSLDDNLTGGKAIEYAEYMQKIATAIDDEDVDTLEKAVSELEKRSFL